jgi:hypothetical protein
VFKKEFKETLKFNNEKYKSMSFRDMLKPYLAPHPWSRFGINLVLGAIADRQATLEESMFLPDYLKIAFANSKLQNENNSMNFVKASSSLFEQKEVKTDNSIFKKPGFVFSTILLLILILCYFEFKKQKYYKLLDFIVFLSIGILGTILFLLWFATDHTAVVKNWNLLWAAPTHLILAFFVFRKSKSAFLKYYFLVTGILAFSILPLWALLPQQFDLAFIPLILLVSIRSMQMFRYYK